MNDNLSFLLKEWTKHFKCMMNNHAIICIHVCNWFTHLQPEWQTTSYWQSYFYSVSLEKCQPACHSWKMVLEHWKWRPYKVRSLVSNSIYAKKGRNGPPSANQIISKDESRCSNAVCTLWVHPPTSPYHQRALPEVTSWSWKSHDRYIFCRP